MMMIAFIIYKKGLVSLLEGLFAHIHLDYWFRCYSRLLLSFVVARKMIWKKIKRQLVQRSNCSPTYTYTCTSYTVRYMCMLSLQWVSIWISSGLSRCPSRHLGSHPSTPRTMCVCVHTHAHTTRTCTWTPCQKLGDTSTRPNKSLTLETSANLVENLSCFNAITSPRPSLKV